MPNRRAYKFILTALLVGAGIACGGNQQSEANKLVGETNKLIEKTDSLIKKTEARNQKLFDADVRTPEGLAAYKIKMKPEAEEIIENYAKASEMLRQIVKNFEKTNALDVPEIYRNYLKTKAGEFEKRAAAYDVRKGNAQAFIEHDSAEPMTRIFDENNSRFEQMLREAEELNAAAKDIENENRDFFAELN